MVTMASADSALKSVYLGVVSEQLNTAANPLLAKIRQSTADVWGKEVRRLAQYGVNGGVGAGTEEGDLPSAAGNNYEQFVTTLKNLYGTIEISDKAVRASENNVGAFVNLLNAEMDGLIKASSFNFGRMLFGDGSGVLCTVSSVSGNTVTADSVKNLIEGMVVDFLDDGSAIAGAAGRRITAVDRDNKTFTVTGSALDEAIAAGNAVCVQGSYNLELTGLGAIFQTTGSLYGLDRATHKWMIPYIKTKVGAISETVIQTAIDRLEETAGSRVDFIVCSWGVKRALQKHLSENKRNIDVTKLAGGYRSITYNGIPVVADRFCPDGTMYLLNTSDFCLHQLCDWKWLEGDDGRILRQVAGKPLYTATLVKYADLICTRPCGQAMLSGITEA
ncbi:MAG TPA: phage major capsid protein [Candidatus Borkfalkia excrementavium]|uniref:Phage major capsid protein n=1 Tax=Candidatus Borkfalkia excrementavium TaxID=2838505 RepID=A0A9D2CGA0_9FIRM|nr:phage major capsid protein [Candidatus Borkfalkia excrementavium]